MSEDPDYSFPEFFVGLSITMPSSIIYKAAKPEWQEECDLYGWGDVSGTLTPDAVEYFTTAQELDSACDSYVATSTAMTVGLGLLADSYRRTDHWDGVKHELGKKTADRWFGAREKLQEMEEYSFSDLEEDLGFGND
ncbi:MAG: hypothetical protein ABEJ36_03715 [Candidatus Nanosalina sp.]